MKFSKDYHNSFAKFSKVNLMLWTYYFKIKGNFNNFWYIILKIVENYKIVN